MDDIFLHKMHICTCVCVFVCTYSTYHTPYKASKFLYQLISCCWEFIGSVIPATTSEIDKYVLRPAYRKRFCMMAGALCVGFVCLSAV